MESFLATLAVVFLAELGDKTQFLVMAFAAKYHWRDVFGGMLLGILVVHSLAVAAGGLVGSLIDPEAMQLLAALMFLCFGVWTLRGEAGEEEAAGSASSPFWTVALTFIVGEMGDKTQFAALAMAATQPALEMVLLGAVAGMVIADSLGVLAGALLHKKLPARTLQLASGSIFIFFGLLGLVQLLMQTNLTKF